MICHRVFRLMEAFHKKSLIEIKKVLRRTQVEVKKSRCVQLFQPVDFTLLKLAVRGIGEIAVLYNQ